MTFLPSLQALSRCAATALLLALGIGRIHAVETVLLGDQFLDDERVTQSLPASAQWFYAGQPSAAARLWVTPPSASGEMRLVSSFLRARSDVTYIVEGSPNLTQWETLATNPGTPSFTVPAAVTYGITPLAPAGARSLFLRLIITNP